MAEASAVAKLNGQPLEKDDDETKLIENELAVALRLQHDEMKDQVVDDLLKNGRHALEQYKEDIAPKLYAAEMANANGKLMTILKQYFRRLWELRLDSTNEWFVAFLNKHQHEQNSQAYERVLTRTAEYGNQFLKDCSILSVVLQLLLELIDEESLKNTTIFDDIWSVIIEEGFRAIAKYSSYIREEVMNTELDKKQSVLYLALREYYRPRLPALLTQHDLTEENTCSEAALDHLAEKGFLMGIQAIRQANAELSRPLPPESPENQNRTLTNSSFTVAEVGGDHKLEEMPGSSQGTTLQEQIMIVAVAATASSHTEQVSDSTFDDVMDSVRKTTSLEIEKSSSKHDLSTYSMPAKIKASGLSATVSKSELLQKEDLASNYHQLQKKIREISAKMTRDPILRRTIAEKFNEINIVVCGSPRVGKSTLINAICRQKLAKTSPGLHSCTSIISPYYLKGNIDIGGETVSYQYNFWDTPGFENWDRESIRANLERIKEKPKSDILCMIYCASPGSFADLRQLEWLLEECTKQHIFCALVCTNKWSGFREQRDAVMKDFQHILEKYHAKTREENCVHYFGNVGLCVSVNSLAVKDEEAGREYEVSGINELIFGIMQSLDSDKVAQWCMVAFENKPFWRQLSSYGEKLKNFWNKFVPES